MTVRLFLLALALTIIYAGGAGLQADDLTSDQLLRLAYDSGLTRQKREFFVYLPVGYGPEEETKWPVMLFLHGHGQRGNGKDDLDYVLRHGPLTEAWIQRRPLPFIIISPQLPVLGEIEALEERVNLARPERLAEGVPPRNYGYPSELPIQRQNADKFPKGTHSRIETYPAPQTLPASWDRIDQELIQMVDRVLKEFHADSKRVYLTGISLGGFGAFHMAAKYPDRWAAVATVVGTGRLEDAEILAKARLPLWMIGGGKDTVVKPHWLYEMARALEAAEHPALRFTVHEDMDHDAWKRVYEGEDLFNWFLRYSSDVRPSHPEKSK